MPLIPIFYLFFKTFHFQMKIALPYNLFFFLYCLFTIHLTISAQTITPQLLPFNRICAGNFNEFEAIFNHSGFPSGTTFEVELSDPSGSFNNPTKTNTLAVKDNSLIQKSILFSVPTNLIGSDKYKLRVVSSTGVTSPVFLVEDPNIPLSTLNYFSAFFKSFEGVYYINNKRPNATICSGGSLTLSIDNLTPNVQNSSPVNYNNIKYKWFKDDVLIPGELSSSLIINTPGVYYVILDYSSCTDTGSRSNSVKVTKVIGGSIGEVVSSLGNPICSSAGSTILSALSGNSFQWFKDKVKIDGATDDQYATNESGFYTVDVDFGGCRSSFNIDLKTFDLQSTLNIPVRSIFLDGQTTTVEVKTNAVNPKFKWFKNGELISDIESNSYIAVSVGDYKVEIEENEDCLITEVLDFKLVSPIDPFVVDIPNVISPNNDGINDTWVLPKEYILGDNVEVTIMDSNGKVVFSSKNYLNNWPEIPIDFDRNMLTYYYLIKTDNKSYKKGFITLVK